jgi:hypothetical protein
VFLIPIKQNSRFVLQQYYSLPSISNKGTALTRKFAAVTQNNAFIVMVSRGGYFRNTSVQADCRVLHADSYKSCNEIFELLSVETSLLCCIEL